VIKPSFILSLLLLAVLVVTTAACNNRSRSRGRSDATITVDSSTSDGGGRDTSVSDTGASDTSTPFDTSVVVDTGPGGACPLSFDGSMSGTLLSGSTIDGPNNQTGSCGGGSAPDVVLRWVAPTAGLWTIDTLGSDFDTVLYVRSASCTGEEVGCNDDASGTTSAVTLEAAPGQVFFIIVDGFSSNAGSFVVRATAGDTP
jgi:hypothetical protein